MPDITPEHLAAGMKLYGIDEAEARRRFEALRDHLADPSDPICVGCARRPSELEEYAEAAKTTKMTATDYCIAEEGTYNPANGHFVCTPCYVANGMPASPTGWMAP